MKHLSIIFGIVVGFLLPSSLIAGAAPTTAGGDSSPYLVGHWKLNDVFTESNSKVVSTIKTDNSEFIFLNPTPLTLTLEYAFFANDGSFCGCDRDTMNPNGRTRYSMAGELAGGQLIPNCQNQDGTKATDGVMKTIVFINEKNGQVNIGDALQAGYQVNIFSGGRTESDLKAVGLNDSTITEINTIHQQCKKFIGL